MQIRAIYPISAPFSIDSDIIHENYRDLVENLSSGREIRIRGGEMIFIRVKSSLREGTCYKGPAAPIDVAFCYNRIGALNFLVHLNFRVQKNSI